MFIQIFGSSYSQESGKERVNILARQLRDNKLSLWGYEMNKARDHRLHPRLENKDYEYLVPRFPNHSWDISIKEYDSQKNNYIVQRNKGEYQSKRRTKVPEVHRDTCVVKQLSGSYVTRFILLQFEQGFMR